MNNSQQKDGDVKPGARPTSSANHPLRIWPLAILLLGMVAVFSPLLPQDGTLILQAIKMLVPPLCGFFVLVWWLTASRANWQERIVGALGIFVAASVSISLVETSMFPVPVIMVTIPMGMAAFALAAIFCRNLVSFKRTTVMILAATVGFGFSTLLRGGGVWGDNGSIDLEWRFTESLEQKLVAARANEVNEPESENENSENSLYDSWLAQPEWPGFRGHDRLAIVNDSSNPFETDWASNPPEKLWSIPVGPGWSSFSVAGQLLFTQEQRGQQETIVCYSAETGKEIWVCGITSRFEESLGGPGPRATPTIALGDVFALGANGQLMRIDAKNGTIKWQTHLGEVSKRDPPDWGFSSSPWVSDSVVVVHAGGQGDLGTLAFDVNNGALVWSAPSGDHSYSSPQEIRVSGEAFLVMASNAGFELLDPTTGKVRLEYRAKVLGYRVLQPQVIGGDSILLAGESATHRVRIANNNGDLKAEEVWVSRFLKADFNDLVIHKDHAYGFDAAIFCCINLKTGERAWKRGRYGKGQVMLLKESGVLLITTERGKIVLLKANPTSHQELSSVQAIKGKTWNHSVVVKDRLYIRNSAEAACFRLPLKPAKDAETNN